MKKISLKVGALLMVLVLVLGISVIGMAKESGGYPNTDIETSEIPFDIDDIDESDDSEVSEEPSDVSEASEDPSDVSEISEEPSDISEVSEDPSDISDVSEVSEDTSDVSGIDDSEVSEEPTVVYGEVNNDGKIDLKDVLALRKHLAKMDVETYIEANADCNGDGVIDMKDVLTLRKFLAHLLDTLGK